MSRHLSFLPTGGGPGGSGETPTWTQLATAAPRDVSTVDFTDIPADYSDLLLSIEGLSHNHTANVFLSIALSADGSTFGVASALGSSNSAIVAWHGAILIPRFTGGSGILLSSVGNIPSAPGQSSAGANIAWRVPGGIKVIRLAVGAGNFDAGTITLYGR